MEKGKSADFSTEKTTKMNINGNHESKELIGMKEYLKVYFPDYSPKLRPTKLALNLNINSVVK